MLKGLLSSALLVSFSCSLFSQESLLIGSGDQIHVQVFDTPEMDQHPRVTDAGNVPLLFVGEVKVSGMTPGQAALAIEKVLVEKQYMLHPHVAVTVEEYGTQQVSVMGQVRSAGSYDITAPMPILSILSMAGGLTDLADRHVMVQRHSNPADRVSYFVSNTPDKALQDSVLVYPGDTVLVPKADIIYIIGDVARPGGYPISTNDSRISALQAIAMAGFTNKTAVEKKTVVVRRVGGSTQEIPLQLDAIKKGVTPDLLLQADDVVYVPFSWMKNVAMNASSIAASTSGAAIYAGGR